ncbi:Na(+)-translocating NADH-quinone reductase subunit F [Cellulophaga sp. HaHaR_3_176]|uniref:Na(+)-translocating NADH-quinone reductase subunit F n=1 Tax=Cellulophaga sp. HaHaR_3_176 TaxID=1942464 RepID=UPI001C1FC701|nr:Na(+)-translocating NADH-quinone reductase subunit F [Cellulophaga sp. HaHaR_3_176]QWX84282.1 Na(+)-translocating NADH-quinone reductase subunit F [Cellulophaga sp. HaHaR_3_176]
MKVLSEQELHNLAMNIVGKQLEAAGYEFMAVNSELKKNPQFVCLKDKKLHFVVVKCITYPNDPKDMEMDSLMKMKEHALKFEADTFYGGVGLVNAKDYNKPVCLNEEYIVDYDGLIKI